MTRWLKRLLGWEQDDDDDDLSLSDPPRPVYVPPVKRTRPPPPAPSSEDEDEKAAELKLLDDTDLEVENSKSTGFDPYNTGAFNRSDSWEKISKHRDR